MKRAIQSTVDSCLYMAVIIFVGWPLSILGRLLHGIGWACGTAEARIIVRMERCMWWFARRQEDRQMGEYRDFLLLRMAAHEVEEQKRSEAKLH
jgi:hypothetical protein